MPPSLRFLGLRPPRRAASGRAVRAFQGAGRYDGAWIHGGCGPGRCVVRGRAAGAAARRRCGAGASGAGGAPVRRQADAASGRAAAAAGRGGRVGAAGAGRGGGRL